MLTFICMNCLHTYEIKLYSKDYIYPRFIQYSVFHINLHPHNESFAVIFVEKNVLKILIIIKFMLIIIRDPK